MDRKTQPIISGSFVVMCLVILVIAIAYIYNLSYVVVWKKLDDGQWYLHYDIFNSDVPPQPTG